MTTIPADKLRAFPAGGAISEYDAADTKIDPETGAHILADEAEERRRRALIRVFYMEGHRLCWTYPSKHKEHLRGEDLCSFASRLQAFPKTMYYYSRDSIAWRLLGFVNGPDID